MQVRSRLSIGKQSAILGYEGPVDVVDVLGALAVGEQGVEDFYHDLYHHVHHFWCRRHCSVDFETKEEIFDALEYIDESFLTRVDILNCLKNLRVIRSLRKERNRERTERRTPTPAKISFPGEKTCRKSIRIWM